MQGQVAWSRMPELIKLFLPDIESDWNSTENQQSNVAHYTSIDGAVGIIQRQELWFRSAALMSDKEEINHGIDLFLSAWGELDGVPLRDAVKRIDSTSLRSVKQEIKRQRDHVVSGTHIFCTSLHEKNDRCGSQTLWEGRDVAFVFNRSEFRQVADWHGAGTALVQYRNMGEYGDHRSQWLRKLNELGNDFEVKEPGEIGKVLAYAAMYRAMIIKRPEYSNEREWRVFCNESSVGESSKIGMTNRLERIMGENEAILAMEIDMGSNLLEEVLVKPSARSNMHMEQIERQFRRRGIRNVKIGLAEGRK